MRAREMGEGAMLTPSTRSPLPQSVSPHRLPPSPHPRKPRRRREVGTNFNLCDDSAKGNGQIGREKDRGVDSRVTHRAGHIGGVRSRSVATRPQLWVEFGQGPSLNQQVKQRLVFLIRSGAEVDLLGFGQQLGALNKLQHLPARRSVGLRHIPGLTSYTNSHIVGILCFHDSERRMKGEQRLGGEGLGGGAPLQARPVRWLRGHPLSGRPPPEGARARRLRGLQWT